MGFEGALFGGAAGAATALLEFELFSGSLAGFWGDTDDGQSSCREVYTCGEISVLS